jgi:signal peptidase II
MAKMNKIGQRCKNNIKPYLLWLLCTAALVAADQISKVLAVRYLPKGETVRVIPYVFNFVYVENRGAAWGMLADQRWIFIVISSVAIVVILAALLYMARAKKTLVISLLLILSGGIGNMIDRVANGFVVDFIQFGFWQSFPVFNVADSFVTIGGAMLLIYYIFIDRSIFTDKKKKKDEENNSDTRA